MSLAGVMFFGLTAAIMAMLFKQGKTEYGMFIMAGAGIFLFLFTLREIQSVLQTIRKIQGYLHFDDAYVTILVKIVGISYLTQFSSDVCRDCGYQSLANQLQIFGKISVLAVSMPVVLALLETVFQVLE